MNDNRKSVLEQALDAVRSAFDADELSEAEYRDLLDEFKAKLAQKEKVEGNKAH